MKQSRKNKLIAFLIGSLVGILILILGLFQIKIQILLLPAVLGIVAFDGLLAAVKLCQIKEIFCTGLGFDGGPLEWLEWASLFVGMMLVYGLIFLAGQIIYSTFVSKFRNNRT